jgi:hypothetical protein
MVLFCDYQSAAHASATCDAAGVLKMRSDSNTMHASRTSPADADEGQAPPRDGCYSLLLQDFDELHMLHIALRQELSRYGFAVDSNGCSSVRISVASLSAIAPLIKAACCNSNAGDLQDAVSFLRDQDLVPAAKAAPHATWATVALPAASSTQVSTGPAVF